MTSSSQKSFATEWPEMYNKESRENKANRIIKILAHNYGSEKKLKELDLLDIGSSTGIMDNIFAGHCKSVTAIDSDQDAVRFSKAKFRRNNLKFQVGNALDLSFPDNYFDIVVCSHIYEHVSSSKKLFSEIYRTLKPNGICYLAAINKLWVIEPHYKLPFLSYLPKKAADYYVKLLGKANDYSIFPESYWGLKGLTKQFKTVDYTLEVINNPKKFGYDNTIPDNSIFRYVIHLLSPLAKFFSPTFFWVLKK